MKGTILTTLALIPASSLATDFNDIGCSNGGLFTNCYNPAPGISRLYYNDNLGKMSIWINGVEYDSAIGAIPQWTTTWGPVSAYASDGSSVQVQAVLAEWRTRSGRIIVTHWELKGGSVQ